MEKILLHGENSLLSRQQLSKIKEGLAYGELEEVSVDKFAVGGIGFFERRLFGGRHFILLEFFEKEDLKRIDPEKLSNYLSGHDLPDGFVVWCGFDLTASSPLLKILQKEKFWETKVDVSVKVFNLVDAFFDSNRNLSKLYQWVGGEFEWEKEGIFLVLMLTKKTRQLLWSYYGSDSAKNLHPYVQKKLAQSVASLKEPPRLLKLYKSLALLESNLKSRFVDLESHFFLLYESLAA